MTSWSRSELVFCRGEVPHAVYTFKHALVRDAAYSGLLKSPARRTACRHRRGARAGLAGNRGGRSRRRWRTISRKRGGSTTRSSIGCRRPVRTASLRSANLEAIAHAQHGIEALDHLPDGAAKDRLGLDFH